MATVATPYNPSKESQDAIIAFLRQAYSLLNQQWNMRGILNSMDLAYMREVDWTEEQYKAKHANRSGDPTKFQNVIVPIVMPQVEAAVTYQQSVFLQGYPYFGVVSTPENMDEAMAMETIIGEQQIRGQWFTEFTQFFRNNFKYNLAAIEVDWKREVTYALETDLAYTAGREGKPKELIWQGNSIRNLDMYNTFFDTRVFPSQVAKNGEFAGYVELFSLIRLKQFLQALPYRINQDAAFASGYAAPVAWGSNGVESYFLPQLNPNALLNLTTMATTDWYAWAGLTEQSRKNQTRYQNMYQVTTLYGRICPGDFGMRGVPGQGTPQVWKFIIVNNQVVVYCERLTNAHQLLPILMAQANDDGLGYQTKSFSMNIMPFQEIMSALTNSTIAARRRAISDRMLFDPTRVSAAQINSDSPTAKIAVKPSAFGGKLSEAVFPIPFNDNQFQFNAQELQLFSGMADQTSGLNRARQGQFVKGNKTRFEYADVMGNANGRDQSIALTFEANLFTPLKEIIKLNILQYQPGTELLNRETNETVTIDPVALRKKQFEFKLSDGLLPSEKLVDGESMAMALQTIAASPQLAQGFNLPPMFSYLMKTRGARLQPFEKSQEQLAFEQAMGQWQQAVMTLAETYSKLKKPDGSSYTMEEIQKQLPPQPTPEQFNYNPQNPVKSLTTPTAASGGAVPPASSNTQSPSPTGA